MKIVAPLVISAGLILGTVATISLALGNDKPATVEVISPASSPVVEEPRIVVPVVETSKPEPKKPSSPKPAPQVKTEEPPAELKDGDVCSTPYGKGRWSVEEQDCWLTPVSQSSPEPVAEPKPEPKPVDRTEELNAAGKAQCNAAGGFWVYSGRNPDGTTYWCSPSKPSAPGTGCNASGAPCPDKEGINNDHPS